MVVARAQPSTIGRYNAAKSCEFCLEGAGLMTGERWSERDRGMHRQAKVIQIRHPPEFCTVFEMFERSCAAPRTRYANDRKWTENVVDIVGGMRPLRCRKTLDWPRVVIETRLTIREVWTTPREELADGAEQHRGDHA